MKNYTYKWQLNEYGFAELSIEEYTDSQMDMKQFVESMSPIINAAKCGWDSVRYAVMENHQANDIREFMVLCCNGAERWIPIDGNSKGCNFSVLGENLW